MAVLVQFSQPWALNRTWELADRYRRPSNQKRLDCWTEAGSVYSACQLQKGLCFLGTPFNRDRRLKEAGGKKKVFHRSLKAALGIVAIAALAANGMLAQQQPAAGGQAAAGGQPQWKDQGEYDVATAAQKATDPQKKIDALKQWEQKYPDSAFKNQRLLMQAQAYDQLALAAYGKTDPAVLDAGQQAAQTLIDNIDNYFAPAVKPANVTDQQWADAKKTMHEEGRSHGGEGLQGPSGY
jgi:hypothetical protein